MPLIEYSCALWAAYTLVLALAGGLACFAGASKVVVRGHSQPVSIQDVRVGDYVRCFEGDRDLMSLKPQPSWCEVTNFVSQR